MRNRLKHPDGYFPVIVALDLQMDQPPIHQPGDEIDLRAVTRGTSTFSHSNGAAPRTRSGIVVRFEKNMSLMQESN